MPFVMRSPTQLVRSCRACMKVCTAYPISDGYGTVHVASGNADGVPGLDDYLVASSKDTM